MGTSYQRILKSPKWQKKRLEILNRDNFKCVACSNDLDELHVHHSYYDAGKLAWEYSNNSLYTLCHDCHEYIHSVLSMGDKHWIVRNAKTYNINATEFAILNIAIITGNTKNKSIFDLIKILNDWMD